MQYGHFDDERKEYVIDRPDTPRPWSNYLGSTEYGAIITNHAGGYSFLRSAGQGRLTRLCFNAVPLDQPGRYFYVRDNEDGDYWSAAWQPVGKPLDEYRSTCRHGTGYTIIDSQYAGIASQSTYFVPLGQRFEYWVLKLTNESDRPRKLSVFTYVEFPSEWDVFSDQINIQYTLATGRADFVDGMIDHMICNDLPLETLGLPRQRLHTFLAAVGADITGYDTDRDRFLGSTYRTYANPLAVEQGQCSNSQAWGDNACGTLQMAVELAPGESREIIVMMGFGVADEAGRATVKEFGSSERVAVELDKVRQSWHAGLGAMTVETPDADFNSMMNAWSPYNCLVTFRWSRSASLVYAGERGGFGYRDTVQDIMGVALSMGDEVRQRMELMLTGQCSTGGAMPVVKPFEHKPGQEPLVPEDEYRSDDCMWLFMSIPAYVKESGNMEFYRKVLSYADSGEDTVLGHLRRAIEFNFHYHGAHGLPAALKADWNDWLHLGFAGESVMVAFQLRYALLTYVEIAERLGMPDEAGWARGKLAELDESIGKCCWDGKWFVRAFDQTGVPIGSQSSKQGQIFLNAQSWAIISGAATDEQGKMSMQAVHETLATEHGITLLSPPYRQLDGTDASRNLLVPGVKENGGIFCHVQGWAVMAEAMLGHGDRAYEYYRAYMPAAYNDKAELRQIEPYVQCQSAHSKFSPKFGAFRLPWLSGTVAWAYYAPTHYILGVRAEYDGLRIDPCLPSSWPEVKLTRRFRGRDFNITIRNGQAGHGVRKMIVNGQEVEGDMIPESIFEDVNAVEVELN